MITAQCCNVHVHVCREENAQLVQKEAALTEQIKSLEQTNKDEIVKKDGIIEKVDFY